jgi:ABC-type taurine transport system substrate-binding protein
MKSVVPLLVAAHLHDLGKLKQACVDLIKANMANMAAVTMSAQFARLSIDLPLLWKETRAALGLPADDDEYENEVEKQPSDISLSAATT